MSRFKQVGFFPLSTVLACAALISSGNAWTSTLGEPLQLAQNTPAPSSTEMEYWRAAERIGTADAYQAYLTAYPNGFYAGLARAAIGKGTASSAPTADNSSAAATTRLRAAPAQGRLKEFFAEANGSRAVNFRIGDRFYGPGSVQIGHLGSRKQLVLPPGEWVALAAQDYFSTHTNASSLTSVAFGKFHGNRLVALLSFSATVRQPNVYNTWADATACQKPSAADLHQGRSARASQTTQCWRVQADADPLRRIGNAEQESRSSLTTLGADVNGAALVSESFLTHGTNGYLRIVRIEWPASSFNGSYAKIGDWQRSAVTSDPERGNYLRTFISWNDQYRRFAAQGFARDLHNTELVAGSKSSGSGDLAGLTEFDPAGIWQAAAR